MYVLIILIVFNIPTAGGAWGSVATAEFDNEQACREAIKEISLQKNSMHSAKNAQGTAICVPKAGKEAQARTYTK